MKKTEILGALKFYGFSQYIINWTSIIYDHFTAKVQNNGYFSQQVNIQKGVHQGGPASSFYFLICAEVLADNLRDNAQIKGIPVQEVEDLLGQFADDMDLYLLYDKNSLENVLRTMDTFQRESGFTVSYEKTQIYRIGSLARSQAKLITQKVVKWTNGPYFRVRDNCG